MRWLVRLEPVRQPRFGETHRDVLRWVVRPYQVWGGKRVWAGKGVEFPTLTAAHRYATGRAVIHYYARRDRR